MRERDNESVKHCRKTDTDRENERERMREIPNLPSRWLWIGIFRIQPANLPNPSSH